MVELALTMKVKLTTNKHESEALNRLCDNYTSCCNEVSDWIGEHHTLSQRKINEAVYHPLRDRYGLLAQMTQSAIRRVIASYKAIHSRMERRNGENPKRKRTAYYSTRPKYSSAGVDLLWNRDYSYSSMTGMFSLPVMDGRIKVKAQWEGIPDEYRTARFGTARLVSKRGKWYLHIPIILQVSDPTPSPKNIVGVDLGIRMLATSYDGETTVFQRGGEVKSKRGKYKRLRQQLQKRGTRSARRRLKTIGDRENRWMTDVNHQASKALVNHYGRDTMFVLEDLTGIRNATERVKVKDRYVQVSWSFYQFRQMVEYKAKRDGQTVLFVDPAYTSQTCPKCGKIRKANRDKKRHLYVCHNCGYQSNDDRIAAMNLRHKGYDLLNSQYAASMTDGVRVQSTTL